MTRDDFHDNAKAPGKDTSATTGGAGAGATPPIRTIGPPQFRGPAPPAPRPSFAMPHAPPVARSLKILPAAPVLTVVQTGQDDKPTEK